MSRCPIVLFASTALCTTLGFAQAADLPVKAQVAAPPVSPAMPNWTGLYVGANAGAAWTSAKANTGTNCNTPGGYFCVAGLGTANGAAVDAAGSGKSSNTVFTGGIEAGFNWQFNRFVYGLETDFDAFRLRASRQTSSPYAVVLGAVSPANTFNINTAISTDWLYTMRGRVGVLIMPYLMGYATGGLAVTRLTVSNAFSDNVTIPLNGSESATASKVKAGWTVGGGFEWALGNNWSAKAEYLYVDFGKVTAIGTITNPSPPGYAQGMSTSGDLTAQVARIGVNRKF